MKTVVLTSNFVLILLVKGWRVSVQRVNKLGAFVTMANVHQTIVLQLALIAEGTMAIHIV